MQGGARLEIRGTALMAGALMCTLFLAPPSLAGGGSPSWSVGDYWEYSRTWASQPPNVTGEERIEIVSTERIRIGERTYETLVLRETTSYDFGEGVTLTWTRQTWMSGSGAFLVKETKWSGASEARTETYDPPLEVYRFPLVARTNWTSSTELTESRPSGSNWTVPLTLSVQVEDAVDVTTGGPRSPTFHAIIVLHDRPDWPYSVSKSFYSDEVGNLVKQQWFSREDGSLESEDLLVSHGYAAGSRWLVVLVVALVVGTLMAAAAVGLSRRRARARPAPPPET